MLGLFGKDGKLSGLLDLIIALFVIDFLVGGGLFDLFNQE